MTKVGGRDTRAFSHITRDFWECEIMARAAWDRDQRDHQPRSEYNNLKVYVEDFPRQLGKVIQTVKEQDWVRNLGGEFDRLG